MLPSYKILQLVPAPQGHVLHTETDSGTGDEPIIYYALTEVTEDGEMDSAIYPVVFRGFPRVVTPEIENDYLIETETA